MSNNSYGDNQYLGLIDKPYLAGDRDYLQMVKYKTWEAGRPGENAEYSEFQKPYGNDAEDYPSWEWFWPDDEFPIIPPVVFPDPTPNPCAIDEDCVWAGIIGPEEMECTQCFMWSQAHLYLGCADAPWWAAFGAFEIKNKAMSSGDCEVLWTGPVMVTVCCDDDATGSFEVHYDGPLGCVGSVEVSVSCDECCTDDGVELTGAETVNAGETWIGTISPSCTGFKCQVYSNSGCVIGCAMNGAGSQVTVSVPGGACGSFTVSVWDSKYGCNATAEATVRITDAGIWRHCGSIYAGQFCSGPWCGGDEQGPGGGGGNNSHIYYIWCYGGGMCIHGDQNLVCDDGFAKFITTSGYCCDGCQGCENSWGSVGGTIWVWECTGTCGT
jgi:hypothetical protein